MSEIEYTCNNCGHEGYNTRAVPDVPEIGKDKEIREWAKAVSVEQPPVNKITSDVTELVRYGFGGTHMIEGFTNGEYVLYSQAAEIIAVKDDRLNGTTDALKAEIDLRIEWELRAAAAEAKAHSLEGEIKRINDAIAAKGGTEYSPTQDAYNLACSAIEKHRNRADDAEAKLAQYEMQDPVGWMYVNEDGECEQIEYGEMFDDPHVTPLYAAPVDQTAEIGRLRSLLERLIKWDKDFPPNCWNGNVGLKELDCIIADARAALSGKDSK